MYYIPLATVKINRYSFYMSENKNGLVLKAQPKDHILTIRTKKDLVNEAKLLGINLSLTLHNALEHAVRMAKKERGV